MYILIMLKKVFPFQVTHQFLTQKLHLNRRLVYKIWQLLWMPLSELFNDVIYVLKSCDMNIFLNSRIRLLSAQLQLQWSVEQTINVYPPCHQSGRWRVLATHRTNYDNGRSRTIFCVTRRLLDTTTRTDRNLSKLYPSHIILVEIYFHMSNLVEIWV